MRIRTFYGAILLLLSLLATAQQKPNIPGIGATIEVSIVNLDVFVNDRDGKRVRGLSKDDFEIFENGVRQPISNFAEYTAEPGDGGEPAERRPEDRRSTSVAPPQKRTVIIFIERFYIPPFRSEPMFASLKKLLHESVRPGDRAMVVTWNRDILLTQQDLTDSMPAIDRTIARMEKLSSRPMLDPLAETRWNIQDIRDFDAQAAANAGVPGSDTGLADLELENSVSNDADDLRRKIGAIKAMMRSVAALEGKKILLLAVRRLSLEAGADRYFATGSTRMAPEVKLATRADMRDELKSLAETANANGFTLYPIFPEGLSDSTDASYLTLNNETPALRQIADATGGLMAWGSADVEKLMPRLQEDLDSYYSLAYRVQGTGADKSRNVEVRIKDPKKKYTVRSRREFVEKSDVTKMEDRVIAALFNRPPSPGFPLRVEVGKKHETRGKLTVIPIVVHIPIGALTALPNGNEYNGAFSVYFAWGGTLGGVSETRRDTKTFKIPAAEFAKAQAEGRMTYEFDLVYNPRTDRLALGVFDEVSKEYALRLIRLKK